MSGKSGWLQIALVVVGFIFFYLGDHFTLPTFFSFGLVCCGLAALIAGAQRLVTGQGDPQYNSSGRNGLLYSQISGRLWGLLFIEFSGLLLVIAFASLFLPGGAQSFWDDLLSRPSGWGIVMEAAGMSLLTYGIIHLLEYLGPFPSGFQAVINYLGSILASGILMFIGVIVVLIGLGLILSPEFLVKILNALLSFL